MVAYIKEQSSVMIFSDLDLEWEEAERTDLNTPFDLNARDTLDEALETTKICVNSSPYRLRQSIKVPEIQDEVVIHLVNTPS